MLTTYIYAFGSVTVISLISLVGIFSLSLKEEIIKKYVFLFISLAVGALLGDAFIHLIPQALENAPGPFTNILIILGIFLFFVMEKFLHWHHHGEDKDKPHIHPAGKLVLLSDSVHNFMDGVIIGASFLINIPVGLATTLAVIIHEIPQEIGDFAVLIHSGYSKSRALWLNFLSALIAFAGVIVSFIFKDVAQIMDVWLLPLGAGGFIYIALTDLIPELQKTKKAKNSILQITLIALGVGIMFALKLLE